MRTFQPVFIFIFSDFLIEVYLLNRFLYFLNSVNKTVKNTVKCSKENTGKVREIRQSENVGTMNRLLIILKQCMTLLQILILIGHNLDCIV